MNITQNGISFYTSGILIIITCTAAAGGVCFFISLLIDHISSSRKVRRLKHLSRLRSAQKRKENRKYNDHHEHKITYDHYEDHKYYESNEPHEPRIRKLSRRHIR